MKTILIALFAAAIAFVGETAAVADPVGSYRVEGRNPDSGGTYGGTAVVTRVGDTYRVEWNVGGSIYVGSGLGGRVIDGRVVVGPAHPDDIAITVGYVSGGTFGMAFYSQDPNGTWSGVWTYAGNGRASVEVWTPVN